MPNKSNAIGGKHKRFRNVWLSENKPLKDSCPIEKDPTVKLPPYIRVDYVSMQEVRQEAAWGITAFNLPDAWNSSQGEGVVIAVLDTGCDLDHQDLVDNLLPGINIIEPGKPPEDNNGHGCHLAGILVALNNDLGVVGVAPKAKVRPVKVLDGCGNGVMSDVIAGIRWCIEQKVDFINLSLGCPTPMPKLHEALIEAAQAGIIVVCAAGNAGNTKEVFYPAAYPETIAVGAIDPTFHRAVFSNTGVGLDFLAPGVDVLSTVPDNWYAKLSGTSMAGPFACAVCALLLSYIRSNPNTGVTLKTVNDYIDNLKKYTIPANDESYADPQFYQGFGIIDPRKFAEAMKKMRETYKLDETHAKAVTQVL
jgi:subtilisin family serine protease